MPCITSNWLVNLTTQCRSIWACSALFLICKRYLWLIFECNIFHLGLFFMRQIFELLPDFQGQYVLVEDQPGLSKEIFPRKVRKRPKVIIKKMEQRAILLRCVLIVTPNFYLTGSDYFGMLKILLSYSWKF